MRAATATEQVQQAVRVRILQHCVLRIAYCVTEYPGAPAGDGFDIAGSGRVGMSCISCSSILYCTVLYCTVLYSVTE